MPGTITYDADEIDDVRKTIARWDRTVPEGADRGAHDAAIRVAEDASRLVASRPGGGTYRRERGAYSPERMRGGGGVRISGGGTAIGAEWGARRGWVFGRVVSADSMRRRQYARWIPTVDGTSGYVVGQTIRNRADEITDDVIAEVDKAMRSSASATGTRTSGRFSGG